MTVEEAIEELEVLTMRGFSEKANAAIRKGISALEKKKKKEQALQEAKTSSNNNNSTSNDNTKSKECQEDIDVIKKLFDVNSFLSGKTNVWCTLTSPQSLKYGRLVCVIDLFKEEKQ